MALIIIVKVLKKNRFLILKKNPLINVMLLRDLDIIIRGDRDNRNPYLIL